MPIYARDVCKGYIQALGCNLCNTVSGVQKYLSESVLPNVSFWVIMFINSCISHLIPQYFICTIYVLVYSQLTTRDKVSRSCDLHRSKFDCYQTCTSMWQFYHWICHSWSPKDTGGKVIALQTCSELQCVCVCVRFRWHRKGSLSVMGSTLLQHLKGENFMEV